MDKTDEDVLIERILAQFDADTILDMLGWSAEDLVEAARSEIITHAEYWEDILC